MRGCDQASSAVASHAPRGAQHPPGQRVKEQERQDAPDEGHQSQSKLTISPEGDSQFDGPEEERRGNLMVVQRAKEAGEVPAQDVQRQVRLVQPEGAVAQVLGHPGGDTQGQRRQQRRAGPGPLTVGLR
jgi:hypothetical protein